MHATAILRFVISGVAVILCFSLLAGRSAAATPRVPRGLAVTPDGSSVWVAAEDGVFRLSTATGAYERFGPESGLPPGSVNAIALGSHGRVWAGTSAGVARLVGRRWILEAAGLPSPVVLSLIERRHDEALLAGTDRGIALFDRRSRTFSPLLDSHEFCRQPVLAIAEEPGGEGVWFARERAFERLDLEGRFSIYQNDRINPDRVCPLPGRYPRTVAVSPEGAVWMAVEGGISILTPPGGRWREIPILTGPVNPSSIPSSDLRAIAFGRDGAAWLAFGDAGLSRGGLGVVRLDDGGAAVRFTTRDGLPSDRVHALVAASDGAVWAATPAGLARFVDGRWKGILWQ